MPFSVFCGSYSYLLFRDGQCPEYSGEEQAICAVGLAKSKPGVFVEAIQYLLVLATPVEVVALHYLFIFKSGSIITAAEIFLPILPRRGNPIT